MTLSATTRRLVLRDGQPVTLRRITGTAPSQTTTDVACTAIVRGFDPATLSPAAGLQQGDRHVTITNHEIAAAAWPGPPRKGDRVLIGGATTTVQSVETRQHRAAIDRHILVVRG